MVSAAENATRIMLGRSGWQDRVSIYLAADCLETEVRGLAEIERRRVYLDDVAMVTRCRRINLWLIVPCIFGTLLFGGLTMILALVTFLSPNRLDSPDAIILLVCVCTFLALSVFVAAHLVRRDDVITVFGRRKKIELRYGFFKRRRCDEAFAAITTAVSAAIERTRAAIQRDRPPPAQEVFPAPEMPPEPPLAAAALLAPAGPPPTELPPAPSAEAVPAAVPEREPDLPLMPEIRLPPKPPFSQ